MGYKGHRFSPGSRPLFSKDSVFTYQQLNSQVNRVSHLFLERGVQKGTGSPYSFIIPMSISRSISPLPRLGLSLSSEFQAEQERIRVCPQRQRSETLIFGSEFAETVDSIKSNLPVKRQIMFATRG